MRMSKLLEEDEANGSSLSRKGDDEAGESLEKRTLFVENPELHDIGGLTVIKKDMENEAPKAGPEAQEGEGGEEDVAMTMWIMNLRKKKNSKV
ncbi:hypothetical protein TWF730_000524 [Orbilia blumenaviensis]|uniref:Uncharacterized protein n=1 Tax=Orbilia blumenaviensis TaxID=1796055 RepID=A0AAV9VLV3_9PEZI